MVITKNVYSLLYYIAMDQLSPDNHISDPWSLRLCNSVVLDRLANGVDDVALN